MINVNVNISYTDKLTPEQAVGKIGTLLQEKLPTFLAERFRKRLIANINNNRFGFTLSKFWLSVKNRMGWDLRPFIAEGYYVSKIIVDKKDKHNITVGFSENTTHPRSGMNMVRLAELLEFGRLDYNLPPRRLWKNTADEYSEGLERAVKAEAEKILSEIK